MRHHQRRCPYRRATNPAAIVQVGAADGTVYQTTTVASMTTVSAGPVRQIRHHHDAVGPTLTTVDLATKSQLNLDGLVFDIDGARVLAAAPPVLLLHGLPRQRQLPDGCCASAERRGVAHDHRLTSAGYSPGAQPPAVRRLQHGQAGCRRKPESSGALGIRALPSRRP